MPPLCLVLYWGGVGEVKAAVVFLFSSQNQVKRGFTVGFPPPWIRVVQTTYVKAIFSIPSLNVMAPV